MSQQEKPMKISKLFRQMSEQFLSSRKYSNNLVDIVRHFDSGNDLPSCLLSLEFMFTHLLKEGQMIIEIIPLKPLEHTPEVQYRKWLRSIYDEIWGRILDCFEHSSSKIQVQALVSIVKIMAFEGKYPLDEKIGEYSVPLIRLKSILSKIICNQQSSVNLVNKFQEYLIYDDILWSTWKILPSLTAKTNPNDTYIMNYLLLLEKMQVQHNNECLLLCDNIEAKIFNYDENMTRKYLNKIWNCVILWEHTPETHKQLLLVLLERVMPYLDKPLLLTDFLMDSLDIGGPVGLLALQGIFKMIQTYNLEYPDIFAKLYSMFEPEIFHTKFKARLYYLADIFLRSTHLQENMVAAFVKRLARLALVAPTEDIIILCMFIANLIIRHQGLKCMLDHPSCGFASNDPYIMDECDPLKSNAINSSLWEIQSLQNHVIPRVAQAAKFISMPLPGVEYDISKFLDDSSDDIFDKEIKKNSKFMALALNKTNGNFIDRNDLISQYWNF